MNVYSPLKINSGVKRFQEKKINIKWFITYGFFSRKPPQLGSKSEARQIMRYAI